jgi:hypothetical protein
MAMNASSWGPSPSSACAVVRCFSSSASSSIWNESSRDTACVRVCVGVRPAGVSVQRASAASKGGERAPCTVVVCCRREGERARWRQDTGGGWVILRGCSVSYVS